MCGLVRPAGERAGEHRGVAVGHEQRQPATRPQGGGDGGQRRSGVVDDLEHAVAQHQIDQAGSHELRQVAQIALQRLDRQTPLGCAALQRRERVGRGIDDGDLVACLRKGYGEAAGAAAGVDHHQTAADEVGFGQGRRESNRQDLPDDRCADVTGGAGAGAGVHAREPRAAEP